MNAVSDANREARREDHVARSYATNVDEVVQRDNCNAVWRRRVATRGGQRDSCGTLARVAQGAAAHLERRV